MLLLHADPIRNQARLGFRRCLPIGHRGSQHAARQRNFDWPGFDSLDAETFQPTSPSGMPSAPTPARNPAMPSYPPPRRFSPTTSSDGSREIQQHGWPTCSARCAAKPECGLRTTPRSRIQMQHEGSASPPLGALVAGGRTSVGPAKPRRAYFHHETARRGASAI